MGFEPTRAEHNGLAFHRLNHSATSSHRGCAIEPDGNTATHPEREGMEGKELDTGDVVPKMASYACLRKTTQALEGPSRRGFEPTRAEHNGLAVHRLNHSTTSSHRGCAIEPDGNTATHPEREGKEVDTGDVVPKMASPTMLVWERPHMTLRALYDEDGIRTHACKAQWISSPSPDGNTATH